MLLEHDGKSPQIDATAYVAPTATVCGDVVVGANSRVMFGASVIAGGGRIVIGESAIVMENAVVRSTGDHSTSIGDHCLIGPNAHLVGCSLEEECFVATGAAVFHGAYLGKGSELRVNGVVHLRSRLAAGATVPIGWIAVGDPARIFPPDRHDAIWEIQAPLDFPMTAYGIARDDADMRKITERVSARLSTHRDDKVIS
jgi:carbonic anhydrase/acetyltransferase-like protein (isoleucine patch superfamily)